MIRLLAQLALQVLSTAVGLWVASHILDGFSITLNGYIASVLFFVAISFVLEPLILKLAIKYIPALRGGIALVTTLVSLVLTAMFTDGLHISGLTTWIAASLVVWLAILLASVILPLFLFKKVLGNAKQDA